MIAIEFDLIFHLSKMSKVFVGMLLGMGCGAIAGFGWRITNGYTTVNKQSNYGAVVLDFGVEFVGTILCTFVGTTLGAVTGACIGLIISE